MKTSTSALGGNAVVSRASNGVRIAAAATTWLVAALMAVSGVLYLTGAPPALAAMHALGYPLYFLKLLGSAKILGSVALVGPRVGVLREWAYAGFVFDLVAAVASHVATKDAAHIPLPLVVLVLVLASYALRRRVAGHLLARPVIGPSRGSASHGRRLSGLPG